MAIRPTSQMLLNAVIPEVRARVAAGKLKQSDLPLEVSQFRIVQHPAKPSRVEINEDVQLELSVVARTPIKAGQQIALEHIDPETCRLKRPTIDGQEAAYYFFQSNFLK